jgi:hypothetical protein
VLPLRALTVGDILDGGFRLLRDRFGRILVLVLVLLGPFQLLMSFATDRWIPALGPTGPGPGAVDIEEVVDLGALTAAFTLGGVLWLLVYLVVAGAIVWLVLEEDAGRGVALPAALRGAARRLWPLVGGTALVGLAGLAVFGVLLGVSVALGALALPLGFLVGVPAGMILLAAVVAATTIVVPVAMAETERGAASSAGRAMSLVARRFWRMVGVTLLIMLVLMVVTFAISLALAAVTFVAGPLAWVVDGVGGTVVSAVTTPVLVFAVLLLYVDARVRLEGWDLQLRSQRPRSW